MLDAFGDQAEGLRRREGARPVQVIGMTSGKGGVGKTNASVNLSVALAGRGRRVMLLDGDAGLGNTDVLLGLYPRLNLSHVVEGSCALGDIVLDGPGGIRLVPAASGASRMSRLTGTEQAGLVRAFGELDVGIDVLVVDTAAGVSDQVTNFLAACQEVVVVVCDEPASITDAYALIKILNREQGRHRFRILTSMSRGPEEARRLYMKLLRVTDRFLSVSLDFVGTIPFDEHLRKAVQQQRAVVDAFPASPAAGAFKKLAAVTDKWPVPDAASGRVEFFVERLIQTGQRPMEVPV